MQSRFIWALLGAAIIIFILWFLFFLTVRYGVDPVGFNLPILEDAALIGDAFGILNSLFTGLALVAIVIAIFMQARQLDDQVKTNALYKQEVAATLAALKRDTAWKAVEGKMHLIPILSEVTGKRLAALLSEHGVQTVRLPALKDLFKATETIQKIKQDLDTHRSITIDLITSLREELSKLKSEADEISLRIEEISKDDLEYHPLLENLGDLALEGMSRAMDLKNNIERLEKKMETLPEISVAISELEKLKDEYDGAFTKAYDMAAAQIEQ